MKRHRSSNRLILNFLDALERHGPVGVTRLLTAANLTHARLQDLLADFETDGWIAEADDREHPQWSITEKGRNVLADLRRIDQAMQDHGLGL